MKSTPLATVGVEYTEPPMLISDTGSCFSADQLEHADIAIFVADVHVSSTIKGEPQAAAIRSWVQWTLPLFASRQCTSPAEVGDQQQVVLDGRCPAAAVHFFLEFDARRRRSGRPGCNPRRRPSWDWGSPLRPVRRSRPARAAAAGSGSDRRRARPASDSRHPVWWDRCTTDARPLRRFRDPRPTAT